MCCLVVKCTCAETARHYLLTSALACLPTCLLAAAANTVEQRNLVHTVVAVDAEGARAHPAGSSPKGSQSHGLLYEDVGVPLYDWQKVVREVLLCVLPACKVLSGCRALLGTRQHAACSCWVVCPHIVWMHAAWADSSRCL